MTQAYIGYHFDAKETNKKSSPRSLAYHILVHNHTPTLVLFTYLYVCILHPLYLTTFIALLIDKSESLEQELDSFQLFLGFGSLVIACIQDRHSTIWWLQEANKMMSGGTKEMLEGSKLLIKGSCK